MGNITSLCEICARKIKMNKEKENNNKNKKENTGELIVEINEENKENEDLYLLTTSQNGVPNFIYHEWYKEL